MCNKEVGWDSAVVIATACGLDGPGIESQWGGGGARFSTSIQTSPGAQPGSYTMGNGSILGGKQPGHGIDHQPPSSAEVQERVELYLHAWAFVACYRLNFTFTFMCKKYCVLRSIRMPGTVWKRKLLVIPYLKIHCTVIQGRMDF